MYVSLIVAGIYDDFIDYNIPEDLLGSITGGVKKVLLMTCRLLKMVVVVVWSWIGYE